MSIIADFLDLVKAAGENATKAQDMIDKYGFNKRKSLSKVADDAILQFPVFVTDRINPKVASTVSTAIEGEAVSFVQVAMGLNAVTTDADIAKYIRQFHQNSVSKSLGDASANIVGALESSMIELGTDQVSLEVEFSTISESARDVYYKASLNNLEEFKEALNMAILNEATKATPQDQSIGSNGKNNQQASVSDVSNSTVNLTLGRGGEEIGNKFKQQLVDTDVKKINKMAPTLIHMQVHIITDGKHIPHEFILGVKTVMRLVPGKEMEKELVNAVARERKLFNFFKATTGEMNFFKDFVLAMDNTKDDALAAANNSWAEALRRRRKLSNLPFVNLLPNSTIVVSSTELDYLKREHSINFDKQTIDAIMRHYMLLAFVVVNEITEIVTFHFDNGSTQQYVFDALETRKKNNDSTTSVAAILRAKGL